MEKSPSDVKNEADAAGSAVIKDLKTIRQALIGLEMKDVGQLNSKYCDYLDKLTNGLISISSSIENNTSDIAKVTETLKYILVEINSIFDSSLNTETLKDQEFRDQILLKSNLCLNLLKCFTFIFNQFLNLKCFEVVSIVILSLNNLSKSIFKLLVEANENDEDILSREIYFEFQNLQSLIIESLKWQRNDSIILKLNSIKFIANLIQIQLPMPPRDPRRRRQVNNSTSNTVPDFSISLFSDIQNGIHPFLQENKLRTDALNMLDVLMSLILEIEVDEDTFNNGRTTVSLDENNNDDDVYDYFNDKTGKACALNSQVMSCVCFCLIQLLKKRSLILKDLILEKMIKYNSNNILIYQSLKDKVFFEGKDFERLSKLQNKLIRRFSDRSMKLFLNHLFKNSTLTKENNEDYLKMINSIIQSQDKQRKLKNLTKVDSNSEDIKYFKNLQNKKLELKKLAKAKRYLLENNGNFLTSEKDVLDIMNKYPKRFEKLQNNNNDAKKLTNSEVFNLTSGVNNELTSFDASLLNNAISKQLITIALNKVNVNDLTIASNLILLEVNKKLNVSKKNLSLHMEIDDLSSDQPQNKKIKLDIVDSNYSLPMPDALPFEEKKANLNLIINNFFETAQLKEFANLVKNSENSVAKNTVKGQNGNGSNTNISNLNKIAISKWEKNSWAIFLIRMATRGFQDDKLSDIIRDALFKFFLESINSRMDIVIDWLNEEWYSEYIKQEAKLSTDLISNKNETVNQKIETPKYIKLTIKLLDSIIPFLESKDRKIFIRLLSDLPYLNREIIMKLKSLCTDKLRYTLGLQSLQYLIMVRPPVKQTCIDILQELQIEFSNNKEEFDDMLPSVEKLLTKYKADTGNKQ